MRTIAIDLQGDKELHRFLNVKYDDGTRSRRGSWSGTRRSSSGMFGAPQLHTPTSSSDHGGGHITTPEPGAVQVGQALLPYPTSRVEEEVPNQVDEEQQGLTTTAAAYQPNPLQINEPISIYLPMPNDIADQVMGHGGQAFWQIAASVQGVSLSVSEEERGFEGVFHRGGFRGLIWPNGSNVPKRTICLTGPLNSVQLALILVVQRLLQVSGERNYNLARTVTNQPTPASQNPYREPSPPTPEVWSAGQPLQQIMQDLYLPGFTLPPQQQQPSPMEQQLYTPQISSGFRPPTGQKVETR